MSSFAGPNLAMTISARNESASVFRSAMAGIAGFARLAAKPITIPLQIGRGGLGLLRDLNLGLAPVVRGLDNLIERGTGLEVVRKSFESLSGKSGEGAERLARALVNAASGTLRMSEAMQIANRALGSGLSLEQLGTAIEFISKKAITTGKNANEALNTVITGLARGSTLFLDDFGILVDGVDGVRASFDSIKGKGAFDSLGPAAQKAETIRQAIGEMREQMSKIGVTGGETVFQWAAIKNQVGDATDKLMLAVAGSKAMRDSLLGFRDILGGMSEHFRKGGGFMELLTGKGKSGGLLGIVSSFGKDLSTSLGAGFTSVLLDGFANAGEALQSSLLGVWGTVKSESSLIWEGFKSIANQAWDDLVAKLNGFIDGLGPKLKGFIFGNPNPSSPQTAPLNVPFLRPGKTNGPIGPLASGGDSAAIAWGYHPPGGQPSVWDQLRARAQGIGSGMGFGGTVDATKSFMAEFSPTAEAAEGPDGSTFGFTLSERMKRNRQLNVMRARLRNIDRGGEGTRQAARKLAGEDIRRLIRGGRNLSSVDREEIFQAHLRDQIASRSSDIRSGIKKHIQTDRAAFYADPASRRQASAGKQGDELLRVARDLLTQISALVGTLGGENQKLAALARG